MKAARRSAITSGPRSALRTRGRSTAIDILSLVWLSDLTYSGMAVVLALLVVSLGIHEAAHAWVALQCGDSTGRDMGRITLNPLPHIDPFLTVLLPLAMLVAKSPFLFGGARPVPVTYHNLRHPLRDMALVALAGPVSNFLLAVFFLFCKKLVVDEFGIWGRNHVGTAILEQTVVFNLLLAAFNLMPIPPLDGSRVMTWLLPGGLREAYASLERFGILIVIGLTWFVPPVNAALVATINTLGDWVQAIVTLGGLW